MSILKWTWAVAPCRIRVRKAPLGSDAGATVAGFDRLTKSLMISSWITQHGSLDFTGPPMVMGVLNVTPDSFSDGGAFFDPAAAAEHAERMVLEGAGVLDIGAESTRPGAEAIVAEEQIRRLETALPLIRERCPDTPISIDTRSAAVARFAIDCGADIINDISSMLDDERMVEVARDSGAHVILMHMRGAPVDMQVGVRSDSYDNVVDDVRGFLGKRIEELVNVGVHRERMAVDPGIGFGKTIEQNLALIAGVGRLADLDLPVLIGASRKSFLGKLLDRPKESDRLYGSLGVAAIAVANGAHLIRAHDVAATVDVVRTAFAIMHATPTPTNRDAEFRS
jgi:dihydropteroate synthase